MNGIEKITSRIAAEAEEAAAAVLEEAKKKAETIRTGYEERVKAEYEARIAAGKAELEQNVQRTDRSARLDARKALLGVKQELVTEAYQTALQKILALPEEEYVAFLARQAGKAALTGKETILLNASDKERRGAKTVEAANALVKERGLVPALTLSDEVRDMVGGLVLKSGSVEVNCSVESLLELSHNRLDAEVADILFR